LPRAYRSAGSRLTSDRIDRNAGHDEQQAAIRVKLNVSPSSNAAQSGANKKLKAIKG
jgi:hypothetical protein